MSAKSKGKSKKGGKGKGAPPMPKELQGKYHRTASGEPLCFGFNTSTGCPHKNVKPGERCSRGWHLVRGAEVPFCSIADLCSLSRWLTGGRRFTWSNAS